MRTIVRRGVTGSRIRRALLLSSATLAGLAAVAAARPAAAEPDATGDRALVLRARAAAVRGSGERGRLAADPTALVATATARFGDGDAVVRFEQVHRGLPVVGRGGAVRLGPDGSTRAAALHLEESLPADVIPAFGAEAAARAARRFTSVLARDVSAADAHLVVWPLRGGGSRLAYAVLPQVPSGIPSAPRVIVDALDGRVIEARDLVHFAKATVYRSNPTRSPALESIDLAIAPTGATLTSDVLTSANCIDNKTVRPVNLFGIAAKVHVCDIVQTAAPDGNGDFVYTPADQAGSAEAKSDTFSEVSMYFHAARAYEFFRVLQGSETAQVVKDKPLRVVANLQIPAGLQSFDMAKAANPDIPLEPFSNAFFSPAGGQLGAIFSQLYGLSGGGLFFGQGPARDYAYDGDVVYHELTHAVVDATLGLEAWHVDARGAVDAPGAMNEGLADYFSSAITGDPDVGEYAATDLSSADAEVIRSLSNSDACPGSLVGEVHLDSTLFSGAMWQARTSLPEADRPKLDAAVYKAMRASPGRGDVGFDDVAKLFLATLTTDYPAGATALETAMKARGILPSCERIVEQGDKAVKPFVAVTGGFASPGTTTLGLSTIAPGLIQIHAKVPPGSATAAVSFTTRAGGAAPNPLGGGGTPYTPVVLAKFGKPITWTVSRGDATHDADSKVAPSQSGRRSVEVPVPEGATDVYVQIGNEGETDGTYDDVTVALAPANLPPTEPPPAAPPAGGAPETASESGCGCSTPGQSSKSAEGVPFAGTASVLAGLGLLLGRLRRRRR